MRTSSALACALSSLAAVIAPRPASASCIPGFDFAAFGKDSIHLSGGASTDSFDSSLGTYADTRSSSGGDIGTNATSTCGVELEGSPTDVNGNVAVGTGGSTGTVICTSGGASHDSSSVQDAALDLPSVTVPAVGTNQGNVLQAGGTRTLAPDQTYQLVSVSGGGSLTLSPGTYVIGGLVLSGNAKLRVPVGPVTVYITGGIDLSGGAVVNSSLRSSNLMFFVAPTALGARVSGGGSAAYGVYAPDTPVQITGNSDLFGAVVGETVETTGSARLHYDRALANAAGGQFDCAPLEVSRAAPILAEIAGQPAIVQGTFETPFASQTTITGGATIATQLDEFVFPTITGHMRARTVASLADAGTATADLAGSTAFSDGTILFDAATAIPPVDPAGCGSFDGSCRNVFTTTAAPSADGRVFHPPRVQLNDGNAAAIGALIAPASVPGITDAHRQTLVRRVLAGHDGGATSKLGGIDRSTVAVVPPSTLAGVGSRPTITYFGATDGMLHAVCASTGGTTPSQTDICPALGTELWAFLPRVQLPLVRSNTTRIDGSVHVLDAFGDFSDPATGRNSFRTILVFQTGFSDGTVTTPAAYALDVTDPADPIVLWEYTPPSTATAFELGVGLVSAAGPTLIANRPTNLAVLHTSNGGTAGAGVVTTALDLATGARVWQFGFAYPSPPRGLTADLPLPDTGIPGGAVGVDLDGQGFITDYVFGDLFGDLWRVSATDGTSATGATTPLFQFTTNRHPIGAPPAVFSNGNEQFAVFASGGYVDPLLTSWSAADQRLIAVKLEADGPFPLTEVSETPDLAVNQPLATGTRSIAQVLVVGSQLLVAADSADVNDLGYGTGGQTGSVFAYNLLDDSMSTILVQGGASQLASQGGAIYASSSDRQEQLVATATTTGTGVDVLAQPQLTRRLWLITR